MLKDKITAAYAKVQEDRKNAAEWLAIAKEDMKAVEAICRAQKNIDPAFDKKAFLAELDEAASEPKTDPDGYLNREAENPNEGTCVSPETPEN